jgi:hypothetical protein
MRFAGTSFLESGLYLSDLIYKIDALDRMVVYKELRRGAHAIGLLSILQVSPVRKLEWNYLGLVMRCGEFKLVLFSNKHGFFVMPCFQ